MPRALTYTLLVLALLACRDGAEPTAVSDAPLLSQRPIVTVAPFFPVAECAADIGFDIRFGGERVLMTHTTTDGRGRTHTSEHFRVHNFQGWRMPVPVPPVTPADYDVQGGAEMFSTHRDAEGNIHVRIHHGNLVFRDRVTGQRVIAHHIIHMIPGQEPVNFWRCRLVG